jgi:hypothetical protein
MSDTSNTEDHDDLTPYEKFEQLSRKLIGVPKKEIDEQVAKAQCQQQMLNLPRNKRRKSKL